MCKVIHFCIVSFMTFFLLLLFLQIESIAAEILEVRSITVMTHVVLLSIFFLDF